MGIKTKTYFLFYVLSCVIVLVLFQSCTVTDNFGVSNTPTTPSLIGAPAEISDNFPNPMGGGPINCSHLGYSKTKVLDAVLPENGGANYRYFTDRPIFTNGDVGFGARDAIVIRFKAPPYDDPYFRIVMTQASGSLPSPGTAVLSTSPCDFSYPGSGDLYSIATRGGFNMTLSSAAVQTPTTKNVLRPEQTYYINISNRTPSGLWACSRATCDVFFTFENVN